MGNNKYKVLVVEDDRNICSFVETMLQSGGYQVLTAQSCSQGLLVFASHLPDLVVLDLGLPDMDGLEFVRNVRKEHGTPILVLSARTDETDKVEALDLGANDYITKPFGTEELMARIRAALRSYHGVQAGAAPGDKFRLADLEIDYDRRIVTVAAEQIHLTQTEYNVLSLLSRHSGKVLTYATIIRGIWGAMDTGSIKKLQVNMANIRRKLGCQPGDNRYIINELGVGYRIADENC